MNFFEWIYNIKNVNWCSQLVILIIKIIGFAFFHGTERKDVSHEVFHFGWKSTMNLRPFLVGFTATSFLFLSIGTKCITILNRRTYNFSYDGNRFQLKYEYSAVLN